MPDHKRAVSFYYPRKLALCRARGLGVGDDLLYRMLRFYEAYPISATWRKLTWSHLRVLARVPDAKRRREIEQRATREKWDARKLEKQVRFLTADTTASEKENPTGGASVPASRRLEPKRGKPGLYRLVADGDGLAVDLGFTSYQSLNSRSSRRQEAHSPEPTTENPQLSTTLKAGDFVTLTRSSGQPKPAPDAAAADLYTYAAEVLRVVDGDTLWLKIWLKPGHWLKEKVRLRGIDCPELSMPEGKAAKRFVETLVQAAVTVTVTTTKPDKWDRYLCDVFFRRADGEELFLNNLLLENNHARRYDKVSLTDWEE